QAWNEQNGLVAPKSRAGVRDVPVAAVLHDYLTAHKARQGRDSGFVFGTEEKPTSAKTVLRRARDAWEKNGLEGLTPHEARHTFASTMIEAGIPAKRLSVWMGHSSVAFTLDRYAKLFERREQGEMAKLDAFLELADTQARVAQVTGARAGAHEDSEPAE